ncbi:hypothetical protein TD95_003799 [Thielaviopsis punctulata]|uniref:WIBG Mago-binding domain-containing protein n=1 Tax=Thielaviopsis punctulata TaxID=72032 RepID=A0A0F4ZDN1_9PEZI|nr:hypothetical protein TD95_003799 [Thielaviopsis punctulata]
MSSSTPTTAGIVTTAGGDRVIPESTRADGSTRKAIRIRPGFRPAEDIERYRVRGAQNRAQARAAGPPGFQPAPEENVYLAASRIETEGPTEPATPATTKPEKQAPSNTQAKALIAKALAPNTPSKPTPEKSVEPANTEAEHEKKARGLKKKLKQARDLQSKNSEGQMLLPEQMAKVIKIDELTRELELLGFGPEDDVKKDSDSAPAEKEDASSKMS